MRRADRLFDMTDERLLARGGVERIGSALSPCTVKAGPVSEEVVQPVGDHAVAVRLCLKQLSDPKLNCLKSAGCEVSVHRGVGAAEDLLSLFDGEKCLTPA